MLCLLLTHTPLEIRRMIANVEALDLHKTYIDDEHYNSGHGHAYERYGVHPVVGAVVVVRPDQCEYVSSSGKVFADSL